MSRLLNLCLMLTERCNAHCRHCGTRDFMSEGQDMPLKDAFRYIDELAALSAEEGPFAIRLSGGEPFLRYPDLLAVARYSKEKGAAEVSCVTNGFWGKDPATALQWATELSDSGMGHISFSLDDFHQEYIPMDSVMAALTACRKAKLPLAIKCTVTRRTRRLPAVLGDLGNLLLGASIMVQEIPCIPVGKVPDHIPEDQLLLQEGIPQEPCPWMGITTILPDGTTFACCSVGWTPWLAVGSALADPVAKLMRRIRNEPLFAILRDKGPGFFVPYFAEAGFSIPQGGYVNICHFCATILGYPGVERILPTALADWKVEQVEKAAASMGVTFTTQELMDIQNKMGAEPVEARGYINHRDAKPVAMSLFQIDNLDDVQVY